MFFARARSAGARSRSFAIPICPTTGSRAHAARRYRESPTGRVAGWRPLRSTIDRLRRRPSAGGTRAPGRRPRDSHERTRNGPLRRDYPRRATLPSPRPRRGNAPLLRGTRRMAVLGRQVQALRQAGGGREGSALRRRRGPLMGDQVFFREVELECDFAADLIALPFVCSDPKATVERVLRSEGNPWALTALVRDRGECAAHFDRELGRLVYSGTCTHQLLLLRRMGPVTTLPEAMGSFVGDLLAGSRGRRFYVFHSRPASATPPKEAARESAASPPTSRAERAPSPTGSRASSPGSPTSPPSTQRPAPDPRTNTNGSSFGQAGATGTPPRKV